MKRPNLVIQFFCLVIFTFKAQAQSPNYEWVKSCGGNSDDVANAITTDISGNIYISGKFKSASIIFGTDTISNSSNNDMFLVKYNSSGNVLWAKQAGGSLDDAANSLVTDSTGNVYVVGYFASDSIKFGSVTLHNYTNGYRDVFICKYDSLGNVIWAKNAGGSNDDIANSIDVDAAGNIYVTGNYSSPSITFGGYVLNQTFSKIFIVKYDPAGNVIWAKSEIGNFSSCKGIKIGNTGNIYITGDFANFAVFGGDTIYTAYRAPFLIKYDGSGNFLWARQDSAGESYSLALDASDNIYITRKVTGSYTFGSRVITEKFDASGNVVWINTSVPGTFPGQDFGNNISVDKSGSIYLTGSFKSNTIAFGNFGLSRTSSSNYSDIFIVKYDPSGNVLWAKKAGGPFDDSGNAITTDRNGNVFFTGFYNDNASFGSINFYGSHYDDIFFAKIHSSYVWPGDADNSTFANNNDLLPIGLYYGQTGSPRDTVTNLWHAHPSSNWGVGQTNGNDIKHADCNGDGIIDANDTLAINLNFSLNHPVSIISNSNNEERLTTPSMYFITNSSSYNPGDWVHAELWLGTTTTPVNNLYGISFNINYSPSFVEPGSESISYPNSFLGTIGTNALKINKIDPTAYTAYGAVTKINHTNANGYGKIADFNFQINLTQSYAVSTYLSISNYQANDSAGTAILFNTQYHPIQIVLSNIGIEETSDPAGIIVSPNPFTSQTIISFIEEQKQTTIKIMDVLGKEIKSINLSGKQLIIEKGEMQKGIYFVQVIDANKNVVNKKIVLQ